MKRPKTIIALSLLLAIAACREHPATPRGLEARLAAIASEPLSNPPTQVYRYRYRGEVVYYRPPRCCDVQGELMDAHGTTICHPGGGITGQGDGRCRGFFGERSECEVVWSDPRAKPGTLPGCPAPKPSPVPEI